MISVILVISVLAVISSNKQKETLLLNNDTIIFYYGITCPHCKIVEQYISDNNINAKLDIIKKEVYENRTNAVELQRTAAVCEIASDEIGVPFMYYDSSCYVGDSDVIELLKRLVGNN
jgi:glutaredoxin